jgi:cytochrome b pre-mRNA-processing protein 3
MTLPSWRLLAASPLLCNNRSAGSVPGRDKIRMFRFAPARREAREAATRVYMAVLAAARRPPLYLTYGVPDTVQGRFEMVALHIFPVLHRLTENPGDDPELARLITERFVDDMDGALREMGVGDTAVPKRMRTLYESFAGRIAAYRRALDQGDLAEAIQRNVFPDKPEAKRASELASCVAEAVIAVRSVDLADLRRGDLSFPALRQSGEIEA